MAGLVSRMRINAPVFLISAGLIIAFVIYGAGWPENAGAVFSAVQDGIVDNLGWLYVIAVAVFLAFVIGLAISPFGRIKLGPDDAEPDYSYGSWFAMLFSAGMGIGLMFFSVAEPILHYLEPPLGEGGTVAAARQAMKITFFHWGLHAWAIYIIVGLSLAYFSFRHNLPLTIRSALYPLIGERIHGPIGHAIDIFAVLGTMFGVATSLGLGVMQINAGLGHLFQAPETLWMQLLLIGVITLMATASVASGLDRGIRRLSELNLLLALLLLLFVLVLGPTVFLFQAFVQNTGAYLSDIVNLTFRLYAYEPTDWIGSWTLFYWGWWIAWSPFVGMFIARISRGRTIREFVLGVLFVPVAFTFLWLTVFGDTALALELEGATPGIAAAVQENLPVALFALLERFPLSALSSLIATILVVTFFVTSSDSGSLVIDMITSGGHPEPPLWQRVFWALTEGVVAAALLIAGGLTALQTAAIASALPFSLVLLVITYGLYRGLRAEATVGRPAPARPYTPVAGRYRVWQHRLANIVRYHNRQEVLQFLAQVARPGLEDVAEEIRGRGLDARVDAQPERVALTVYRGKERDFLYAVRLHGFRRFAFAFPEFTVREDEGDRYYRAEVYLLEGPQHYEVTGYNKDELIHDLLAQYDRHVHALHVAHA